MTNDCYQVGFQHPAIRRQRAQTRPTSTAYPGLITTAALVFSIAVAAIAVSMGMARADTLTTIAESDGGRFALATFVGLVLAGMGGLTAVMFRSPDHERPE
jgi:hypothetical protein